MPPQFIIPSRVHCVLWVFPCPSSCIFGGLLGGIKLDFIQVLLFLLSGMTFWYPKLCPIREYKKNLETNTLDCHLMLKAFWKLNDDYSKLLASCSLSSGKLYFEQRQAITMIQPRQNKIKKATSFYRSQSNQDTKELRYYNPSFVSFNPALDCGQRLLRPAKKLVIQTLEVIMGNGFVAMSATYSIIVACWMFTNFLAHECKNDGLLRS